MPELLTIDDIALIFRAARRTVAERWIHAPDFPKPHLAPSIRPRQWKREDVLRWAQRRI